MKHAILSAIMAGSLAQAVPSLLAAEPPSGLEVATLSRDKPVDFTTEILPILRKNCLACHNARDTDAELNLETPATIAKGGESGAVVVPGNADKSRLMAHIRQIEKPFMPPRRNKVSAKKLTPGQLGLIRLWINEGAKGEVLLGPQVFNWRPLPMALKSIYTVAISPDGQFAACGRGNQIFIYHLPTRRLAARLADPGLVNDNPLGPVAHRDIVQSLAFSPDSRMLASGGFRLAKLWERQSVAPSATLSLFSGGETVTAFGTASRQAVVIAAGAEGTVQAFDLQRRLPLWRDGARDQAAKQLTVSPGGEQVAVLFADGRVRSWGIATGERVTREASPPEAQAVAWLNDRQLVTAHPGGVIQVWAAINPGRAVKAWKPGGDFTALAVLPGGATILAGRADNKVLILTAKDGTVQKEIDHGAPVAGLRIRVDGKQFTTFGGPSAKLWETDNWTMTAQLHGNPLATESVARAGQALAFVKAEVGYHKADVENKEQALKKDREAAKKATEALAKHEKTLADKTKEKSEAEATLKKLNDEIAALPKNIEVAKKGQMDADAALNVVQSQAAAAKAALAKANEAKSKADAAKVKLSTLLMELGFAAQAARQLAAEARATANAAKGDKDLATQADVAAALAKRKADEFESALDRHAPTKQQRAKADAELKAATKSVADAEAKLKPGQAELDAKAKRLAALEERQKKTPEEKKNVEKKIADAGNAITNAQREIDLAESEVGFTARNVKTAESSLEQAKAEQAEAGERPARHEVALALAKARAAVGMQDWIDAAYMGDGSQIATLSVDGRVQLWSTEDGARSHHCDMARGVQFIRRLYGGRLALAGGSPEVASLVAEPRWALARVIGVGDVSPLEDRVTALDFSPDGQQLATGGGFPSRSGEIYIWNVDDGSEVLRIPQAHSDTVSALAFSPDGTRLATGGTDRFARVFETDRGGELRALEGHTGHVLGVSWQRNGRVLATVGADKAVKIWNLLNGDQKKSFSGFNKEVTSVHFLGIGTQAVVSAGDNVVKIVKEDGGEVRRLPDTGAYMHASDVTPDGRLAVAGGFDGILRVWDVNAGKLLHKFTPPKPSPKVAATK
ncbi:MAG: c-type cytochrome domain-containing protein [Verrucomicrobiota bacterium]|nr:c-type cytochrome domain-containing protein [Verrucomicrobiota bacterium]